MFKYLSLLPILCLTLSMPGSIAIAQSQPKTRIDRTVAPIPKYTGIVKQVDDTAAQITVRIEDKEGNGSGVIVAREGNTYSVVTASHVVEKKEGYSIITPSQERIKVRAEQITILNKDIDIALVKFTSKQNYRVAELANYQIFESDFVFVSGFPKNDTTPRRSLSIGRVSKRDMTEFSVRDEKSLSDGNNLIYTNLSLKGMSGGGVLDRDGRLIGINTGSEGIRIINQNNYQLEEINFGYARGISVSTILGTFTQGQIPISQLKVLTTLPSQPAQSDLKTIRENLLSTVSTPSQTSTAKEWLDYGNLLWRSQENGQAIVAFDRAINILQKDSTTSAKEQLKFAYFGKGLSLVMNEIGKDRGAVVAFRAAIAIEPEFIQGWRYEAMALSFLKRHSEALVSYQQAIKLDPKNFTLYIEQGDVLIELRRYPEAIDSYSRAIQIQPQHPWNYNNRGNVYHELKQYSQALADFSKAIELNPQLGFAYAMRGKVYKEIEQYPQALVDFNKAIEIDPQSRAAYTLRGNMYIKMKQYPQAISDYNKAISLPQVYTSSLDREEFTHFNRAMCYFELIKYPEAIADLNKSIELNPEFAPAYISRGYAYQQLKQYDKAQTDVRKAVQLVKGKKNQPQHQELVTFLKKAAEMFQQQKNLMGYQAAMEVLKEISE
jgi:tetratricopeptide (TPR) repeat protein